MCKIGSNRTEKRKRHRRRYIAKHIAKFQALQIQHDHNTTASIVAAQDVRVDTVQSSMDGVHPDSPDSVIPCAVKDDPVSIFQSFAAQDDSRSPVKLLKEGPSVTKSGSGERTKSIGTGLWLYTPDHSVARSGINVW